MARFDEDCPFNADPVSGRDKSELEALSTEFTDVTHRIARMEESLSTKQAEVEEEWRKVQEMREVREKIRHSLMGILEPEQRAVSDEPRLGTEPYRGKA